MVLPAEALAHVERDQVAWLTTVTDSGWPAPTPVWFVPDGDALVVFSEPSARKVRNLRQRPRATLHFNSDPDGDDIVVIRADVELTDGVRPSDQPGFVAKYTQGLDRIQLSIDEMDRDNTVRLRLTPTSVWLGPT